ncbi:uncharacterized protein LOC119100313 [Pollicipes pollicipes]|uniref:uncharacterized protein LOC119100313 n=1 Tax=Pollicipes pollicipes TaxID=41117 RepID=UPI0018857F06|nr:uncharacterized protein LOC119100313 [Pollicipes pollicipes]
MQDNGLSTKFDSKIPVFPIVGYFSYVDLNGEKQTVDYVIDESGYCWPGTHLPNNGLSTKFDGKIPVSPIVGSFSYVDLNGVRQTVDYVVDESGYRVSGTNLPAAAVNDYALPYGGLAYSVQPDVATYWTNLAAPYTNYASAIYKDIAANAPAGVRPQHDGLSTMFDGKVPVFPIEGSFSYVDLNGVKQTVDFTVDKSGFRVSGTNLPLFWTD